MNSNVASNAVLGSLMSAPKASATKASQASDTHTSAMDFRQTMNDIAADRAAAKRDHLTRVADQRAEREQSAVKSDIKPAAQDRDAADAKAEASPEKPKATEKKPADSHQVKAKKAEDSDENSDVVAEQPLMTDAGKTDSADKLAWLPGELSATDTSGGDEAAETSTALALDSVVTETTIDPAATNPLNAAGISLPQLAADIAAAAKAQEMAGDNTKTGDQLAVSADGKTVQKAVEGLLSSAAETTEEGSNLLGNDANNPTPEMKHSFSKLLGAIQADQGQVLSPDQLSSKTASAALVLDVASRPLDTQAPVNRGFVVQTGVPMNIAQPGWNQAVGEKVLWLAAQNLSSAEIRLDPPELGQLQVKITIQHDQANVSFSSPHAIVREALDQSASRLRDMFSQQGLNLTDVDVSDQSFSRQQAGEGSSGSGGGSRHTNEAEFGDDEDLVSVTALPDLRLVDHYA